MKFTLERVISDSTITLGEITEGAFSLCTLENPWKDNQPNVSCIPTGDYTCQRVISPKYGNTFEVLWVEDRTHILFHYGNWEKNTKGCILLGLDSNDKDMIMDSRKAVNKFLEHTKYVDEFELEIVEVCCIDTCNC